jgi:hypothetical protein
MSESVRDSLQSQSHPGNAGSRSPKSEPGIAALLRRLGDEDIKMLGIHRARFRRLGEEETKKFKSVWISAGLFADVDECNRFHSSMHAPL